MEGLPALMANAYEKNGNAMETKNAMMGVMRILRFVADQHLKGKNISFDLVTF